jgi:hypothetical protein
MIIPALHCLVKTSTTYRPFGLGILPPPRPETFEPSAADRSFAAELFDRLAARRQAEDLEQRAGASAFLDATEGVPSACQAVAGNWPAFGQALPAGAL